MAESSQLDQTSTIEQTSEIGQSSNVGVLFQDNDDVEFIPDRYIIGEEVSTPTGTRNWVPIVPVNKLPCEGMVFNSLVDAYKFYKHYACIAGFEVRKSTQKCVKGQRAVTDAMVKLKYFVCSKEGKKNKKKENHVVDSLRGDNICSNDVANDNSGIVPTKKTRQRSSKRTGCLACIRLEITPENKYEVYVFRENHNHPLVHPEYRKHLKASRKLNFAQKTFIHKMGEAGIGPVVSYRALTKISGGPENVGASKVECKNYKRDVLSFIGKYDCQMAVDLMQKRKESLVDFSFEYFLDVDGRLGGMFWADECSKRNFAAFGDVVSFDATYRSNKYDMVFIPFTGIDNHKKCVTFGGGILTKEDAYSYEWLVTAFKKAFSREPLMVLTDQDPAMKVAISKQFLSARHRLCMWHIMQKVSSKVSTSACDSGFKAKMSRIVWTDKLDPVEFDILWDCVIKEFHLEHNKWLEDMFHLRKYWIPAYFRDWEMSGLMRTSSRSESENHMFGQLMNSSSTLVEFFSHFDTAMLGQRFSQSKNDHDTRYTTPKLGSDLGFEKDAMMIYTRAVYLDVKAEIQKSIRSCMSLSYQEENANKKFKIVDTSVFSTSIDESIDRVANPNYLDEFFPIHSDVSFNTSNEEIGCSCKRFERFGLFCRHIFYVLRLCKVEHFPKKYICKRWTRDVVPPSQVIREYSVESMDKAEIIREIQYNVDACIGQLIGDKQKLLDYLHKQQDMLKSMDAGDGAVPPTGNKEFICSMVGIQQPTQIDVLPPENVRNKGSGSRKRLCSSRETSMKQKMVKRRTCSYCGVMEHNSRGCPKRKQDDSARKNSNDGVSGTASNV